MYVTSTGKSDGSRRLFFSTVFPGELHVFCTWQEKAPLNQTVSSHIYTTFVDTIENSIKSNVVMNALKQLIVQQGFHLQNL